MGFEGKSFHMVAALLGKKIGMTRVYTESGEAVPVTVIQAGPCSVLQVKTADGDGQVRRGAAGLRGRQAAPLDAADDRARRARPAPARSGSSARSGSRRPREASPGDVWTVEVFETARPASWTSIGTTKGHGFTGVMKRHGFGGQPASHGTERKHRSPGGIGGSAQRGRGRCIKKGKRMAGHMGNVRRTSRNQELVRVDKENNLLLVKGSVPGPNGGYVLVRQAKAKK